MVWVTAQYLQECRNHWLHFFRQCLLKGGQTRVAQELNTLHSKFLSITTENKFIWNTRLNQLLSKLSRVCFVMRTIKSGMLTDILIRVYHTNFHSLMSYGLIFWGNFSYSTNIFRLHKVLRIIASIGDGDSCRDYFKNLTILPLQSQYLLSVSVFVVQNMNQYKSNT